MRSSLAAWYGLGPLTVIWVIAMPGLQAHPKWHFATCQMALCHLHSGDGARTVLAMSMTPSALHTTMGSSMVMLVRKVGLEPSACRLG